MLEAQSFVHVILSEMKRHGLEPSQLLKTRRLVVTSKYCGLGTMHIALNYFVRAFETLFGIVLEVKTYSMCDKSDVCKSLLECFWPEHLSEDVLDPFHPSFIADLNSLCSMYSARWADIPEGSPDAVRTQRASLLKEFQREVEKVADREDIWCGVANCLLQQQEFSVVPPLRHDDLWLEMLSPTCTSWSKRGSRRQWIDASNIPLLAWAISTRKWQRRPHLVLLECTPELDLRWLEKLSDSRLAFQSVVLGPGDVGIPTTGDRVWATSSSNGVQIADGVFATSTVMKYIMRSVEMGANSFLQATRAEINAYEDFQNAKGRKIPKHPRGKRYRARDMISACALDRLQQHELQAAHLRAQQAEKFLTMEFIFDITQSIQHSARPSGLLSRQLRNSSYWSERRDSFLVPLEHMVAQGSIYTEQ